MATPGITSSTQSFCWASGIHFTNNNCDPECGKRFQRRRKAIRSRALCHPNCTCIDGSVLTHASAPLLSWPIQLCMHRSKASFRYTNTLKMHLSEAIDTPKREDPTCFTPKREQFCPGYSNPAATLHGADSEVTCLRLRPHHSRHRGRAATSAPLFLIAFAVMLFVVNVQSTLTEAAIRVRLKPKNFSRCVDAGTNKIMFTGPIKKCPCTLYVEESRNTAPQVTVDYLVVRDMGGQKRDSTPAAELVFATMRQGDTDSPLTPIRFRLNPGTSRKINVEETGNFRLILYANAKTTIMHLRALCI